MFGLGSNKTKKENIPPDDQRPKLTVYTIPKEFYAGANPVIKFQDIEKQIDSSGASKVLRQPVGPVPSSQVKTEKKPVTTNRSTGVLLSKKLLVVMSAVLFLVFVVGVAQYYWEMLNNDQKPKNDQTKTPVQVVKPAPTTTPIVTIVEPVTTTDIVATSTEPDVPTTTPALAGASIEFPSILLGNSADLDGDKVTDAEEDLFGTDPGKADTDGDGYEDSTEIFYLYSPSQFAPVRMMGTGVVKEFTNPIYNYKIYYPASWTEGSVDREYREMLFSTVTGEYIEVRVFDKVQNQSFEDWFTNSAKNEQLGLLKDFQTVFKESGRSRSDNLVYYFEDDRRYYVIVYHITGSGSANYRNIITMVARSFRTPSNIGAVLPEQKVIREAPSSTTP